MRRRELILVLRGMMTGARGLRAQRKAAPVIGYLSEGAPNPAASVVAAFRQGLRLHRGSKRDDRIPVGGGPL
jgi:hypothetical protein